MVVIKVLAVLVSLGYEPDDEEHEAIIDEMIEVQYEVEHDSYISNLDYSHLEIDKIAKIICDFRGWE